MFELNQIEKGLVFKSNNINVGTNWCQEGKMQEKGKAAEELVTSLLSLCDNVKVIAAKRGSALDEVLKVDVILETDIDTFAFQIKCSEYGRKQHISKYGEYIEYEGVAFRTPWCLVVDGSKSNNELLDLLIDELCLEFNLDLDIVEDIALQVASSNSKRLPKKNFKKLSSKERKALRLLHNIGTNAKTYFVK